jgi:hypothetical protein
MADKKISALTGATTPLDGTEVLPIVQSSATVKVATNDLTVRNIRANATTGILQVTGPTAATTRVMTVPDANFTAARTDAAQSFTGDQTLSTGNLVIGTSGKGIDFSITSHPAGMTSELLADYEEGTFTPAWTGSGGDPTVTYIVQTGQYTKVGNVVYFNLSLISSAQSGGSGDLGISGLPYSPSRVGVSYPTFVYNFASTATAPKQANVSGTTLNCYTNNTDNVNAAVTTLTGSGGSVYFNIGGFYYV